MTHAEKAGQSAAFRFISIDRQGIVIAATWVGHVVLSASDGALHPSVKQIECEGCMNTNAGVQ
jgi:hypothetical protein